MSAPAPGAELALLIDTGSTWTKASLVGRVRGRWRVVAHLAQPSAWGEDELLRALAEQLAPNADQRLVESLSDLVTGATRIECHTPRRIGRLALAAVSRELSGAAARRAAESAGWEVPVMATLDDGLPLANRLAALQATEVDAWLLGGGFDDGWSPQALEAAALVAAARRRGSGPVIWAGSRQLAVEVAGLFEEGAVTAVPNARPDARTDRLAALRDHLEELLRRTVEPGTDVHLAPVAFRRAVTQLARAGGLRILAVDLGAHYATWVLAGPEGAPESRIFATGGLGRAALQASAAQRVARVMPEPIDELAVADVLQNLRARPAGVPQTDDELAVTHAAARIQLATITDEAPGLGADLLIGAGRTLAAAPHPGAATRMLLDGVRPVGVTQLALDVAGVLGPLGALSEAEVGEGIALLADDLVVPLGTAVVCRGGEPGRSAMQVTVHRPGWPDAAPVDVRTGQLQVVPLPRGSVAELLIEPADGVVLGAPRRSPRIRAGATGGISGLLLDARGVPATVPRRADDRRAVLAGWRDAVLRESAGAQRLA